MLQQINTENFQQMLHQFSTPELESMIEKFPYFQQAHVLLAKKYQQENSPKFDQQLQLAALYIQDRELLYTLFNEKNAAAVNTPEVVKITKVEPTEEISKPIEMGSLVNPDVIIETISFPKEPITLIDPVKEEITNQYDLKALLAEIEKTSKELTSYTEQTVEEKQEVIVEITQAETIEVRSEEVAEAITEETEEPALEETSLMEETPVEVFSRIQPHTFDEWLKAFNNKGQPEEKEAPVIAQEEVVEEKDELSELLATNTSIDYLHELVKEETTYAKGLERFIEEQIQKHKQPEIKKQVAESDLNTEPATETMAKVYEMQKKYAKAIKTYEALTLKFPEKSSLFAARINYLKNIV